MLSSALARSHAWHSQPFSRLGSQLRRTANLEEIERRLSDAPTLAQAQQAWALLQQHPHITTDHMNLMLSKQVKDALHLSKTTGLHLDTIFNFVAATSRTTPPNLSTFTLLAVLVTNAPDADPAYYQHIEQKVNRLCQDVLHSLKRTGEDAEGLSVLLTFQEWLHKYLAVERLGIETYRHAFATLYADCTANRLLTLLKECHQKHPVDDSSAPHYHFVYKLVANKLFIARKPKRLLKLFFQMQNHLTHLPLPLVYCALDLCSRLQPRNTRNLFKGFNISADQQVYEYFLASLISKKDTRAAMETFAEMKQAGIQPSCQIFWNLMKVHKANPNRVVELYLQMREEACDRPQTYEPYEMVLKALKHPKYSLTADGQDTTTLRLRLLDDIKADGHKFLWFLRC
eukprot:NODE_2106_length_1278_cov_22.527368_g2003_i0.p1 GENE.NODE_2106_length_1278_cov_22.527368_g2003_i0~~NODE_2106_length_1278_cov_22.527368_g2003_i0.p1  ORF type:complete len:400 (-),score=119.69 NODE_2106_length_1278_cov_22.527368_g2003_i0:24-1223(-)